MFRSQARSSLRRRKKNFFSYDRFRPGEPWGVVMHAEKKCFLSYDCFRPGTLGGCDGRRKKSFLSYNRFSVGGTLGGCDRGFPGLENTFYLPHVPAVKSYLPFCSVSFLLVALRFFFCSTLVWSLIGQRLSTRRAGKWHAGEQIHEIFFFFGPACSSWRKGLLIVATFFFRIMYNVSGSFGRGSRSTSMIVPLMKHVLCRKWGKHFLASPRV